MAWNLSALLTGQPKVTTRESEGFPFPDYPTSKQGEHIRADLNLDRTSLFGGKADVVLNFMSPDGKIIKQPQSVEKLSLIGKTHYGLEGIIPKDAQLGDWQIFVTVNGKEIPETRKTHKIIQGSMDSPLGRYKESDKWNLSALGYEIKEQPKPTSVPKPVSEPSNIFPAQMFSGGLTTLSQGKIPTSQRLIDLLPEPIRKPVGIVSNILQEGVSKFAKDWLFFGGGLNKTENEKIIDRGIELERAGIPTQRAIDIAVADVRSRKLDIKSTENKKLLTELSLTPKEKGILSDVGWTEKILTGLDIASLPLGITKTIAGKPLVNLLKTAKTELEVFDLLKKAGVSDEIGNAYKARFAKETDEKIIQQGIDEIENLLKTTKKTEPNLSALQRKTGEVSSDLTQRAVQSRTLEVFKKTLRFDDRISLNDRSISADDFYKSANPSESLTQEIKILEETLRDHQARPLMKRVSRQTGTLPDVTGQKKTISLNTGKKLKTSDFGRRGDDIVTELGFETPEDANKAVTSYQKLQGDLVETKKRLSDLKKGFVKPSLEDIFTEISPQPSQGISPEKAPGVSPVSAKPSPDIVAPSPFAQTLPQLEPVRNLPMIIQGEGFIMAAGDKVRVPTARQLLRLEDKERRAVIKAQDNYLKGVQKEIEDQLGAVGRARDAKGETELIISKLKEKGVADEVINEIVLEDGTKLIDTVKIKREENGVLSAVITKQQLKDIGTSYKGKIPTEKWIKRSVAQDAIKFPNKVAQIYEVPQVYFERKGLKEAIYDPIRQAQRGANQELTNFTNRFEEAGLFKKGSWFTADRFTLTDKEADNIGKYFLTRQGKGYDVPLASLSVKEKKFVEIFDGIIKDTEPRFFEVAKKNGKEPTKVEDYAPIMTRGDIELIDKGGDMDFITRKHPSFFSTKERVEKIPVQLYETDYREVVARWLNGITKFNSLGDVGVEIKYLIESEQFKGLVSQRDNQVIHDWFKSVMTPDIPKTEAVEAINFVSKLLRKSSAISSLGLNYASVVKQALTQVPLTIIEKAPPKLRSKFADAFGIKVSELPSIKERKGDIAIVDLQGKIGRVFTGSLTTFDQKNAQVSLNALLDKEYNKFLKAGIEVGKDQQAYILKQAQDRLDLWYGGMTKEQLPPAFRQEIGRFLNMFILPLTSQLNGFFQHILKAKGAGTKAKAIAEVLSATVVIAYLEQAITNLSPEWSDKVEMTKDVTQSLAGNIPVVSQVVYALASDQDIQISAGVSGISNLLGKINDFADGNATLEQLSFAVAETAGLPKQIRRIREGMEIIEDGGIRDKEGKMLAPVTETDEFIRSILRGKYGSTAAKDWIRNIGEKKENRKWFVPQVEFLQNGDYDRKAELYKSFTREEQKQLRSYLSEGQQKKLDKALGGEQGGVPKKSLESIFR